MVDELGLDDLATGGEDEGYVPCDELAASETDLGADALAVSGEDEGFVPFGTGAAADATDESDTMAVYGRSSGFVAKPCNPCDTGCVIDDFSNRTLLVNGGLFNWALTPNALGASSCDGTWETVPGTSLAQSGDYVQVIDGSAIFHLQPRATYLPFNFSSWTWRLPYTPGAQWDRQQYTFKVRFMFDQVGTVGVSDPFPGAPYQIAIDAGGALLRLYINNSFYTSPAIAGALSLVTASDSEIVGRIFWDIMTPYIAEVAMDFDAGTAKARVYVDDGTPPVGWDIAITTDQTSPAEFSDFISLGAANQQSTTTFNVTWWDVTTC